MSTSAPEIQLTRENWCAFMWDHFGDSMKMMLAGLVGISHGHCLLMWDELLPIDRRALVVKIFECAETHESNRRLTINRNVSQLSPAPVKKAAG